MLAFEWGELAWSGSANLESGLLILIALLVGSSLGLVWGTLLVVESLPALTEDLTDLAEGDVGVLSTNVLTLLIGEEHVGGEAALGATLCCHVSDIPAREKQGASSGTYSSPWRPSCRA